MASRVTYYTGSRWSGRSLGAISCTMQQCCAAQLEAVRRTSEHYDQGRARTWRYLVRGGDRGPYCDPSPPIRPHLLPGVCSLSSCRRRLFLPGCDPGSRATHRGSWGSDSRYRRPSPPASLRCRRVSHRSCCLFQRRPPDRAPTLSGQSRPHSCWPSQRSRYSHSLRRHNGCGWCCDPKSCPSQATRSPVLGREVVRAPNNSMEPTRPAQVNHFVRH